MSRSGRFGSSPYGAARSAQQPPAARLPDIHQQHQQQQQRVYTPVQHHPHSHSSGGSDPAEWLNSPRTHRMLELLGVQSDGDRHAPSAAHSSPRQDHSSHGRTSDGSLAPHPPSEPKSIGHHHYHTNEYGTPHDQKEHTPYATPSHTYYHQSHPPPPPSQPASSSAPPPRLFLALSGAGRSASRRPPAARAQSTFPLRPIQPNQNHANSGAHSARAMAFAQPTEPTLSPDRQLIVDFLTAPSCTLFRQQATPATEYDDANHHADAADPVELTDAHLDSLLSLPGITDAPSLVRSLRSLMTVGHVFDTPADLISGMGDVLNRKLLLRDWLVSAECKLFRQSPVVMFVNMAAVDRLVEESGASRLGQIAQTNEETEDGQQPPMPPTTQPYDDVWHVLLRLNSDGVEVHYFSELIHSVRRIIDQALRDAGVDLPFDESHSFNGSPRKNRPTQTIQRKAAHRPPVPVQERRNNRQIEKQQQQPPPTHQEEKYNSPRPPKKSPHSAHSSPAASGGASSPPSALLSLRSRVVAKLSHPSTQLFLSSWPAMVDRVGVDECDRAIDELTRALEKVCQVSGPSHTRVDPKEDHQHAISLLQQVEESGARFDDVAALLHALRTGEISAPAPAQPHSQSHASVVVEPATPAPNVAPRRPVKPTPTRATPSTMPMSTPTSLQTDPSHPPAADDADDAIPPGSFDSDRRRMAVLAHLATSSLILPRPSAHELHRQVFDESVDSTTLQQIELLELETHKPVFASYKEILTHIKDRAIDSHAALRQAVSEFLAAETCILLPSSPAPDDVSRLIDDGGAGYSTLKHLRAIEQTEVEFDDIDQLIQALQEAHQRTKGAKPHAAHPKSPSTALPAAQPASSPLLLGVHKLAGMNIHPEEPNAELDLAHAADAPVVPPQPTPSPPPRAAVVLELPLNVEEVEGMEQNLMEDEEATHAAGGSTVASVDSSVDVVSASTRRVNAHRRCVWDYVNSPSCHLLPVGYIWTVDDVENMVDDIAPGEHEPTNIIVEALQEEERIMQANNQPPYATVAELTEKLYQRKYYPSQTTQPSDHPTPADVSASDDPSQRALNRINMARLSVEEPLEQTLNDAQRSGRLDAKWRIAAARQKEWEREKFVDSASLVPSSPTSVARSPGRSSIPTDVPLVTSLTCSASVIRIDDEHPVMNFTIDSASGEVDQVFVIELALSNTSAYVLEPTAPLYLRPGASAPFVLRASHTGVYLPASNLTLRAKAVLATEPDNFTPEELWAMNVNRITQVGVVCRVNPIEEQPAEVRSVNRRATAVARRRAVDEEEEEEEDELSSHAPTIVQFKATLPTTHENEQSSAPHVDDSSADSSIRPMHLPDFDDTNESANLAVLAEKRRQKRMTQAVDMAAIRASGMLKKRDSPPLAAPTASNSSGDSPKPMIVSSLTSPVAIAVADSQTAQLDPTTKRRAKRMTQVTGSLAEHVKLAAAAKAVVPPVTQVNMMDEPSEEMPVEIENSASPIAIAKMDDEIAQLSEAQKRKAKRSTQAVDPLLAAAMMNRVLAARPAEAVESVGPPGAPVAPSGPVIVASSSSSSLAIAAADSATAALSDDDRRRRRRQTAVTNQLPENVRIGGAPHTEPTTPQRQPRTLATSVSVPTITKPNGPMAVAIADTQVAAMSAREKQRSRRMTQALFDSSYDPDTAARQRAQDIAADAASASASAPNASVAPVAAAPPTPSPAPASDVGVLRSVDDISSTYQV